MTVLENVMVSQHSKIRSGLLSRSLTPSFQKERAIREKAYEYLELLGLETHVDKVSGSMPYGEQRKLEIARALATEASLLLFDEPTAGMNPQETSEMMRIIMNLRELGKTIILIEHDMRFVMGISDRIIVLDHGVKIAEGTPEEIKTNRW
jgi:branched-chain amino acid transport system ATP-binding protein